MCATQRCDACQGSLVSTVPPHPRFICMECPISYVCDASGCAKPDYDPSKMQLCRACFNQAAVLHQHARFVCVESDGVHQTIQRKTGLAPVRALRSVDLLAHKPGSWAEGEDACGLCFEDFNEENPPCSPPGCTQQHGIAIVDSSRGTTDSKMQVCRECLFKNLIAQGYDSYCARQEGAVPCLCLVCLFHKESKAWGQEFSRGVSIIDSAFAQTSESDSAQSGKVTQLSQRKTLSAAAAQSGLDERDARHLLNHDAVLQLFARLAKETEMNPIRPDDIQKEAVVSPQGLSRKQCLELLKQAVKSLHKQKWLHEIIDRAAQ
eukprot:gb/GEZN01011295.1/.p1 GENE.gb/GEZN01011295.1/~~gb/GEZN01011295.1/.p1  ORF type:complete len:376 (-),score=60.49 gb/GEZN01011295.1/:43-1002(-)